ncbi:MAG: polysaccharide deacetylase [Clostridia bacterium]|nr:polysaccharide deacetylase [Clostridia bacterium]
MDPREEPSPDLGQVAEGDQKEDDKQTPVPPAGGGHGVYQPRPYPADHLVLQPRSYQKTEGKIAYLTFDDGPSPNVTPQILQILKEKQVPATFFVIGTNIEKNSGIFLDVYKAGHAIGNHTYSHKYSEIYTGPEALLADVEKNGRLIEQITGLRPVIMRTPGGTAFHFNYSYFNLMDQAGYLVYDWNVSSQDATKDKVPKEEIVRNVLQQALKKDKIIVLMHDGKNKDTTAEALA